MGCGSKMGRGSDLREGDERETFRIRYPIKRLQNEEFLVVYDVKGNRYIWDGTELYKLKHLKGKLKKNGTNNQ